MSGQSSCTGPPRSTVRRHAGELLDACQRVDGPIGFLLGGERSASMRAHQRSSVIGVAWDEDRPEANGRIGLALSALMAQRLRSNNALLGDLLNDEDRGSAASAEGVLTVNTSLGADRPQMVVRESVNLDDLRSLIDGSLLAVRIPSWYTRRQSQQLCRQLLRHPAFSRYSVAPNVGVQRVGL